MADPNALAFGVPTIASSGAPQVVNPLAAITAGNAAAAGMYDLRAKQAQEQIGNILQQATDPQTGTVDHARAQALAAAAGPGVQIGMQSFLTNNSSLRGAQITQAAGLHGLVTNLGASLMNDPSDENVAKIRASAIASGLPASAVAEIDKFGALPAAQRGAEAYKHVVANVDALGQLARGGYPTPQMTAAGDTILPVATKPATPYGPASTTVTAGGVQFGIPPTDATKLETWTENGVPMQGTHQQFLTRTGTPIPQGGAIGGRPQPGPAAPQPTNAGPSTQAQPGVPNAGGYRLAPNQSTPAANAGAPGKPIPAPTPDDLAKWEASSKLYNGDAGNAATYQQRVFPLAQAYSLIKGGDVTTGQGAEAIQRVKSVLQTFGAQFSAKAQTDPVAAFEEVNKYLQQYVNGQNLSGRSDQAMASAISGNPSAHISTLANEQILPVMIGMERMNQLIFQDYQKQGGHPRDYQDYRSQIQNKIDPRAFMYDMLDGPQRTKMVASMSKEQKIAFANTLDLIEKHPGIMGQAAMPH